MTFNEGLTRPRAQVERARRPTRPSRTNQNLTPAEAPRRIETLNRPREFILTKPTPSFQNVVRRK